MALTYPGRTFSGSQKPSEWFGNVTPAKTKWQPRAAAEGGGMPRAGYIPNDMWASIQRQAPGDLGGIEDAPPPPGPRFAGGRASMQGLLSAGSDPNSLRDNIGTGSRVIQQRGAQLDQDWMSGKKLNMPMWQPYGLSSSPLDHFLTAMVGKEANTAASGGRLKADLGGIGRMKGYDPALNQTYDLEGGEQIPKDYSASQMNYISRSQPAMNALRRASGRGKGPVLV